MADYSFWHNALAGKNQPVHDSDPQPGFYRKRTSRSGPFIPVAIWEQDGKMLALVDGRSADAESLWTFVCKYPILEAWYHTKMAGQPWPDESPAVAASLAQAANPAAGHEAMMAPESDTSLAHDTQNSAKVDEAEILKDQIETAKKGLVDFKEINDDEAAKRAQGLRSLLLDLSGNAEKKRVSEKAPHLAAGNAVDAKWNPLVKDAKASADSLRAALSAHETRKLREEQAARQKAADEAAKAAAEAAKAAPVPAAGEEPAKVEVVPAPVPPPQPVPETATAIRGGYGRAASIKTKKQATVVDQDKAYMAMRTHKELVELIAKLAQRAAEAGIPVDGVTVEDVRDVR